MERSADPIKMQSKPFTAAIFSMFSSASLSSIIAMTEDEELFAASTVSANPTV